MIPRLERDLRVERLDIGPLSVGALHRVLADELGRTFPRPTLVRLAQTSVGNPLYAIEIARLIDPLANDADAHQLPVPTGLDELVRRRVGGFPEATRAALLRAAALASPDTRVVSADDLAPAEEKGLVRIEADRRIRFVHPLFASAVYAAASLARRRATHRALAGVVTDQEERVRHLALGCDGPDEAVAVELQAAAEGARRRGAPSVAAELTQLALRLVDPNSSAAQQLQLEAAEHLFIASDFRGSRALLEELRDVLGPGELRARALLTLAEIEYWRSGESAAMAVSEEALAATADPVLRARCETQIAMHAATVDLPKAAAAAQAAVDLLDGTAEAAPALVAAALGARVRARLFLGEGYDRAAADRALELESSAPPATVDSRVAFKLAQWLRYVDDLEAARAQLDEVEQQARDEGDESSLGNILLNRVIVETWLGDWQEAATSTERMGDAFAQQGVTSAGIAPWLAYLDAYAGRLDSVRSVAGLRPEEPVIAAIWSRCLGLAELAAGDWNAAYEHLAAAMNDLDGVNFREPGIWRIDGDAIEAALAAGAVEQAERWLRRFEERAARSRIPWSLAVSARCRGLLAATGGELETAAEALERSLSHHQDCRCRSNGPERCLSTARCSGARNGSASHAALWKRRERSSGDWAPSRGPTAPTKSSNVSQSAAHPRHSARRSCGSPSSPRPALRTPRSQRRCSSRARPWRGTSPACIASSGFRRALSSAARSTRAPARFRRELPLSPARLRA